MEYGFIYNSIKNNNLNSSEKTPRIEQVNQLYQTKLCKGECGINTWKTMNCEEKNYIYNLASCNKDNVDTMIMNSGYYHFIELFQDILMGNVQNFFISNVQRKEKELLILFHEYLA